MYLKKLKIGNIELKNNLILAPMAGVTDLPFRIITEKFEPGLVCTEMVSSKALFFGDEKIALENWKHVRSQQLSKLLQIDPRILKSFLLNLMCSSPVAAPVMTRTISADICGLYLLAIQSRSLQQIMTIKSQIKPRLVMACWRPRKARIALRRPAKG